LLQTGLSLIQASLDFWRIESGKQFSGFYFLPQDYWQVGDAAGCPGLNGRAELGSHRAHYVLNGGRRFGFDGLGADLNQWQITLAGSVALVRFAAAGEEHHARWQCEYVRPQPTQCRCNRIKIPKFGDLFHLFLSV
jgi:hypothetical protein